MYNITAVVKPEEGTLCDVITESGAEFQLLYTSNLWFLPDMSMYVYFTPLLWKVAENG